MGNKFFLKIKKIIKKSPLTGRTIALSAFFLLLIKQFIVFDLYGAQMQGHYIGFLANDLLILSIIVFLLFLSLMFVSRVLRMILNTISALILFLFAIDISILYYFQSRLSIYDLYAFITTANDTYFIYYIIGGLVGFLIFVVILFFVVQKYFRWIKKAKRQISLSAGFFLFSFLFSYFNFSSTEYQNLQQNVLSLNIQETKKLISGEEKIENIGENTKAYEDYFTTIQGKNSKVNVILVLAESFSTVDSKRAGGLYDNFPLFDKIQKDGITFTNFMANGCTSETAHIAILQGVEPRQLPVDRIEKEYYSYASYTDALPVFFNKLGYQTTFLSTVRLDFLNQRKFLEDIKFQNIIGEEYFEDEEKYMFDAAPDHVLYDKALQTIESHTGAQPYFLAMQTISSHVPYDTPFGKGREESLQYVDRNIYAFYQKLKKIGFFDDGILIVVGDHRKVESIQTKEFKEFGMTAHSRVVATVIGTGIEKNIKNDGIFQHLDIFNSLKYLFGSGDVVVSDQFNNIFDIEKGERDWGIRYCRFAEKNYVVIKDDGEAYTLRTQDDPYIHDFINAYKQFEYKNLVGTGEDKNYFTNYVTELVNDSDINLIAHRGDPTQNAENSFKGFALAKEHEAQGIEFDVSLTKDGETVVFHGPSLKNTTCGEDKNIYEYTLQDLQRHCILKNGEKIMSLEELLNKTNTRFDTYILELKIHQPKDVQIQTLSAIETVIKLNMQDRVIFTSYDKKANEAIGLYPGIIAGWDTYTPDNLGNKIIGDFPHKYFLVHKDIITADMLYLMKSVGKEVIVYTVNTKQELEKISAMGVKNIITDDVLALKKWLK